jgi:hypothetical protein
VIVNDDRAAAHNQVVHGSIPIAVVIEVRHNSAVGPGVGVDNQARAAGGTDVEDPDCIRRIQLRAEGLGPVNVASEVHGHPVVGCVEARAAVHEERGTVARRCDASLERFGSGGEPWFGQKCQRAEDADRRT